MGLSIKKLALILSAVGVAGGMAFARKGPKPAPKEDPRTEIYERSADSIIKNFMFVGDFNLKEDTRPNSHEVFWRYPSTLPKVTFELDMNPEFDSEAMRADFPATQGEGRAFQHMNRGRVLFLEGNVEEARKTWLSGRARYGRNYAAHRRTDYFIAQAFMYQGWANWKDSGKKYDHPEVRQSFVNATTFLAWAFDRKKDIPDALLERVSPRAYYNQSVIYFNYERWAGVSGSLTNGLDFLRRTGRKEYRREMHRMMAEIHIRNRSYLEAVQELDMTLRQDEDTASSAAIFARIGDIYYDLNNFELAEEVYAAANKINRELNEIRPSQYVLRGESLFWLGRFEEARKTMQYALQAAGLPQSVEELDTNMQALASLRIADTWLATKNYEKARLSYFQHGQEFRGHVTANFAKIRLACLELPEYEGNNIRHARQMLEELKGQNDIIPPQAQEMAWTCETASYAQHERTPEMVERVRAFAQHYPNSDFLQKLVEPVREVQSLKIEDYFKAGDIYGAVQFFEKTRTYLFPVVNEKLANRLFAAYAEINQAERAREFFDTFEKSRMNELGLLQLAAVMVDLIDRTQGKEQEGWIKRNRALARELEKLDMFLPLENRVRLYLHRIINHKEGSEHYPWILALGLKWVEDDVSIGCDIVYPMLQKIQDNEKIRSRFAVQRTTAFFIDSSLKDLLRFETNCAYSLMEFELDMHKGAISELAQRYLKRDYIPFNPMSAAILWHVAEEAHAQRDSASAVALWKLLTTKGGPEIPEVRYAQGRLNVQPTETENLWQN
ncbi:MAG TPA: tetratricopeptide repeat protein [Oligoflexus sp.]|uniref:tetratricopeptide repeat protein n=1 Tax=Oligoflexus sp. TaxID=1971216 RepID=UPI002D42D32A|nr:tetratricopeptide repeat protein [Oligoflexus sp.]HYX33625.1 tetratricopeptide repeat protein [Oligoflexus sp.]